MPQKVDFSPGWYPGCDIPAPQSPRMQHRPALPPPAWRASAGVGRRPSVAEATPRSTARSRCQRHDAIQPLVTWFHPDPTVRNRSLHLRHTASRATLRRGSPAPGRHLLSILMPCLNEAEQAASMGTTYLPKRRRRQCWSPTAPPMDRRRSRGHTGAADSAKGVLRQCG